MLGRIQKLQDSLSSQEAYLVSSPLTISYFTGFHGFSPLERNGYLYISAKNATIITSALFADHVKFQTNNIEIRLISSKVGLSKILQELCLKNATKVLCVDPDELSHTEYLEIENVKIAVEHDSFDTIREIKDQGEIDNIQKACAIADHAFKEILQIINPGKTELQIALLLENSIRSHGGAIAFPPVVACGHNTAFPHHYPGTGRVKKNDIVLLDFGAVYNGYCSDMTRTIFVGTPAEKIKKMYATVSTAQQKAVGLIKQKLRVKSKIKAKDVDAVARNYILSQKFPSIPHSLGHGIGLAVHESPRLSPRSDDLLQHGVVFSIEPGIYLPNTGGIRIEDLYTIDKKTLVQLTHSPSEITAL